MTFDSKGLISALEIWPLSEYSSFIDRIFFIVFNLGLVPIYVLGSLLVILFKKIYRRINREHLHTSLNSNETQPLNDTNLNYGTLDIDSRPVETSNIIKPEYPSVYITTPKEHNQKLIWISLLHVIILSSNTLFMFFKDNPQRSPIFYESISSVFFWCYAVLLAYLNQSFVYLNYLRGFYLLSFIVDCFKLRKILYSTNLPIPLSVALTLQSIYCFIELILSLYSFLMNINLAEFNKVAIKSRSYPSPEPYESLLSIATFSWMNPLMKYGYNNLIEPNGIWSLRENEKASSLLQNFLKITDKWSFAYRIFYNFKKELFLQMIFTILTIGLNFLSPLLLHEFLRLMENSSKKVPFDLGYKEYGFYIVACLFFVATFKTIMDSQSLFYGRRIGIRVKSIIIGKVYSKTLKRKDVSSQRDDPDFSNSGKVINLMSVDAKEASETCSFLHFLYSIPIQILLSSWYLYQILGWPAMIGLSLTFIAIPINYVLGLRWEEMQSQLMTCSDKRMDIVNELLQGIRIIKFFAWEAQFQSRINSARTAELNALIGRMKLIALIHTLWLFCPTLITIGTFYAYTKLAGNTLTPTIAFTSILIFKSLRDPIDQLPQVISMILQAKISFERIDQFLKEPETEKDQLLKSSESPYDPVIGFKDATIQWGSDEAGSQFKLSNLNLSFPLNKLSIIVGPTGCGKTSLLLGLLGEMTLTEGSIYLPKKSVIKPTSCNKDFDSNGGIAYVIQSAWIQQDTIRNNILFGEPYNEARYQEVVKVCALLSDFNSFKYSDLTEVGEKGITLSGGQKQRISLARAVYSKAAHIIMDDCLSALDSHTAKFVFHNCLMGKIMKGRTRILVTHNVGLTFYHADYVVVLNGQGKLVADGSCKEVEKTQAIKEQLNMIKSPYTEESGVAKSYQATPHSNSNTYLPPDPEVTSNNKLVLEEKREKGAVKSSIYYSYFKASGGYSYWLGLLLFYVSYQALAVTLDWWIKIWADSGDKIPNDNTLKLNDISYLSLYKLFINQILRSNFNFFKSLPEGSMILSKSTDAIDYYINTYLILSILSVFIIGIQVTYQYWGSIKASRMFHDSLLNSVLHAPIRFFEITPIGRLVNRFSKDIESIDQEIMDSGGVIVYEILAAISILVLIAFTLPQFLIATLVIIPMVYCIVQFYVGSSREIKRIESTTNSPIYSQSGETLQGVTTIRAYEQIDRFETLMYEKVDDNIKSFFYFCAANNWLSIRLDLIGGIVTFISGVLLLLFNEQLNAALIGLILTYALNFSSHTLWVARFYSNIEIEMNSIERIQEYLDIPPEPPRKIPSSCPPPKWPTEGKIEIKDLVLSYSLDCGPVIKGISLSIKGGEKIGIVGRTGAGKSTLALAFFRFIDPESGSIHIDDIDIHKIGLFDLRSNLTIIPQDATLFSGTIRSNLDPFNQYDDQQLWNSLRRAHLIETESTTDLASYETSDIIKSLDQIVTENGQNFSQGQRQLLSLARALLKQSKVIIMDEATASVDYSTDIKIQKTIRQEFYQSTLLCIAHRLRSIIDFDKVVIMDHGIIKEFDDPANLIQQEDSLFRAMCQESGDFENLKHMAQKRFTIEDQS
ncbi:hypothetical protein K502DRAFT_318772 [Neoconidiobolus thromboides FSU 785]|nr:hypothetical protein K502DRAFT_318772 [Neoconidiobolus thromboides FSU 785]